MILPAKHGTIELTPEIIRAIKRKWPTKDVDGELEALALWLIRNPKSRPALIFRAVDNWMRKAPDFRRPQPTIEAWWSSEARTLNQGEAMIPPIRPRPGENLASLRDRISAALGRSGDSTSAAK